MKFYYEGKLMRTSKTHEYKFALLNGAGTCLSCSGTRDGIERERQRRVSESRGWLEIYEGTLAGTWKPKTRGGWKMSDIRRMYKTDDDLREIIGKTRAYIDGLKIVPLEMR